MKRWTFAALAAASLLSATAIAKTQLSQVEPQPTTARTATHWRTAPANSREKVGEYVPSVNYVIEGQTVGVSVIPNY
jgi:hypothetical protein